MPDLQVRELLKDHKDLVGMLNAQFVSSRSKPGNFREALYRYCLSSFRNDISYPDRDFTPHRVIALKQ